MELTRLRETWQRVVGSLSPAAQIEALERYGFAAIYVNRAGYPDHGDDLLEHYKAAGRGRVIESPQKDLYCVVLNPSPHPQLPAPGPFFAENWYAEQDQPNGQQDHMASGNATLILSNQTDAPVNRYVDFYLLSAIPRYVQLNGGGAVQGWKLEPNRPVKVTDLRVTLAPGENQILFQTDEPGSPQQIGLVTFDVVNFQLKEKPGQE